MSSHNPEPRLRRSISLPLISAIFSLTLILTPLSGAHAVDGGHPLREFKVEAAFDDVKFDVENAIVNAGYKIIYNGNIGEMLENTAGEVGVTKKVFSNAEFLAFCSAPHSHASMSADPRNIAFCPYIIYLFALEGEAEKTTVGYRRPVATGSDASIKALGELDKLLERIIKEAVE